MLAFAPFFVFSSRCCLLRNASYSKNRKTGRTLGFTLIEMMAAMTVSSTLLVLATGMIHQAMRLQTRGRQQAARQQTALHLASQFRRDVQRSRQASLGRDGAVLTLEPGRIGEAAITYTAQDGKVVRDQLRADRRHGREPFRFTPDCLAHFELLPGPRRAVLVVTRPVDRLGGKERLELHVEAVVDRHRAGPFAEHGRPIPAKKNSAEKTP